MGKILRLSASLVIAVGVVVAGWLALAAAFVLPFFLVNLIAALFWS